MSASERNLMIAGGVFHPPESCVPSVTALLQEQGIETDVEEDVEAACQRLAQGGYRLLTISALRWRMDDPKYEAHRRRWALALSEPARQAITGHLRAGGALLALHTASLCFDDWPQWGEILGGRWVWGQSGHAPFDQVEVRFNTAAPHRLTEGLTDFSCPDEVYERLWLAPDVQPLAHARNMKAKEGQPGDWAPVLWTRQWEGARVVYDALGHDAQSLDHPVHRQLIQRAAAWALGRS
jgi:hypothetical protein